MCGIAGSFGPSSLDTTQIEKTLERMYSRGPDFQSYSRITEGHLHLAMLHSRLSIIDLDTRSNQPFSYNGNTIVFNGEIYNFKELRDTLLKKGVTFQTESDTEVLLHYYDQYGKDCVEYFEGMWAFAIWDSKRKELFLSRDRFGEKPLFYTQVGQQFYFASETAFLELLTGRHFDVNQEKLLDYLIYGFRTLFVDQNTYFKDIVECPHGSSLTVNRDGHIQTHRFHHPSLQVNPNLTRDDAVNTLREKLLRSLELRLRADVPVAFCLSGGVDSAGLVSLATKEFGLDVHTYSIVDSDVRYNEKSLIDKVVHDTKCKNTQIETSREGFFDRLRALIDYHNSPIATISYYVHSFLSERIAQDGFKVVLSGTGADEITTGYFDHFLLQLSTISSTEYFEAAKEAWIEHVKPLTRNPALQDPMRYITQPSRREHLFVDCDRFHSYLNREHQYAHKEFHFCDELLRNRMLNELFYEIVPVILREDDLNSMMHSIENRSPYLDSSLLKFALTIPPEFLIEKGYAKSLLRGALKGFLIDDVRLQREKKGFNASINSLVDFENKETRDYLLDESPVFELVNRDKIAEILTSSQKANSESKFLFNFINTKMFLER